MRTKAGNRFKKVVVIGGSQGAIEALLQIMPSLPADLPSALFVVVHLPVEADSYLPKILGACGTSESRKRQRWRGNLPRTRLRSAPGLSPNGGRPHSSSP